MPATKTLRWSRRLFAHAKQGTSSFVRSMYEEHREQSGLNELRFVFAIGWALAFRCIFFFGDPLDAATCTLFQLTEVSDDSVTRPFGGTIRFHQRPVREFFAVRFFVAWFDEHAGIVSGNDGLSLSSQGNFS